MQADEALNRRPMVFTTEKDRYNNVHLTLERKPRSSDESDSVRVTLAEMQRQKKAGTANGIYFNIPFTLLPEMDLGTIASLVPPGFPVSPVRDTQKKMMRFLDAPATVPTGANIDLGAMAIVWDPEERKVLTVTDNRSGRLKYPGGRWDPEDGDAVNAARRECLEESNYEIPQEVEGRILGLQCFPQNESVPGYNIPFLFIVPGAAARSADTISGDGVEMSRADWLPLTEVHHKILPALNPEWLGEGLEDRITLTKIQTEEDWYEFYGVQAM